MISNITKFKRKPGIVLILDRIISPDRLALYREQGVDLLELRVDLFDSPFEETISFLQSVVPGTGLPVIGTIRETAQNRLERVELFKQIIPYVDYIDIELDTPISEQVFDAAKGRAVVMVSEHDFEKTPDENQLSEMVKKAVAQGAEIVKIATMAHDAKDVTRLLTFTENCETPLVSIAMGEHGKVSRVIAPLFGSLFTYGFEGTPVAPGQIPVEKLIEQVDSYFPSRKL